MSIEVINIRATVDFYEKNFSVSTPYIQSFNVTKARNAMSTCSLSVKILASDLDKVTGELSIYAGTTSSKTKIFTGFVKKVIPSPVWDDPKYLMLNITVTDILYRLENKKVTRRQLDSDTSWAMITEVRSGNKSSYLKFAPNEEAMIISDELKANTINKEAGKTMDDKLPEPGSKAASPNIPAVEAQVVIRTSPVAQ